MIRLYPLILGIQLFCLYHAYSKRSEQKWFWIIIIFPFIGSCIYLYHHFYSRNNIDNLREGIKETFVSNYTINKLEQKVKFADTYTNKMELAQEHIKVGNNNRAVEILESCYTGDYQNDLKLNTNLITAHYENQAYEKVVYYGKKVADKKDFDKSNEKISFAWATYKVGNKEEAKKLFQSMDHKFCNYMQRLEYAYFLEEAEGESAALSILNELMEEIQSMDNYEKRLNKNEIRNIKHLYKQLSA